MKTIIVTPAGRKRYLNVLLQYIIREIGTFDEWHLWLNTNVEEDIEYCRMIADAYSWIKIKELPDINCVSNLNIRKFFKFAIDSDTIYIRLDDDISYLEKGFFTKMVNARLSNPDAFLVYANIINNAMISHLHQKNNLFDFSEIINYNFLDKNGWESPYIAEKIHRKFIQDVKNNDIDKWHKSFDVWELKDYERVSINCISWFGEEFAKFNGEVGNDEEEWLSSIKSQNLNKPNIIVGSPICAHFSFFTQREHLDKTNILEEYNELINYSIV